MSIRIVVDSTADIPSQLKNRLTVIPLNVSSEIWNTGGKAVRYVPLCSVIGAHAGAGAVVVAFFKKQ